MNIAVDVGLIALALLLGGGILYLIHRGATLNERAWKEKDKVLDLSVEGTELGANYATALNTIARLEQENVGLKKALKASEDSYNELATHSIEDVKDPRTATIVRLTLERYERMRKEMSAKETGSEDRASSSELHESTTETSIEG